jgi:hypothetical protein
MSRALIKNGAHEVRGLPQAFHLVTSDGDDGELESLDMAIKEVRLQIAANGINSNYLWGRLTELESGRKNLRRKRATSELDAFLPPIRFYSIKRERGFRPLQLLRRVARWKICL